MTDPIKLTEEQIKHVVDRFLSWKLPEDFSPDGGISLMVGKYEPTGTNLFSATQAEAMVRYITGQEVKEENATFYAFRPGGSYKWAYSGRGHLSLEVFSGLYGMNDRREQILRDNDGKFPGMATRADDYLLVVIPDDGLPYGWPLMLMMLMYPEKST